MLSDYGSEYMLNKVFENTDVFQVALFLSGTPDDTPVLEEVEAADYTRVNIKGSTGGAFEYQTLAGAVSTVDTGIGTYKFIKQADGVTDIKFVFAGPLTSVNKTIVGYAVLMPGTFSNPFPATAVVDSGMLPEAFTPNSAGDTLILDSINIRLSKGTVS